MGQSDSKRLGSGRREIRAKAWEHEHVCVVAHGKFQTSGTFGELLTTIMIMMIAHYLVALILVHFALLVSLFIGYQEG
jgi:hypothetical protein